MDSKKCQSQSTVKGYMTQISDKACPVTVDGNVGGASISQLDING